MNWGWSPPTCFPKYELLKYISVLWWKVKDKDDFFGLLSSPPSLQRWSIIATMHSPTHQVYTVEIDSAIALNCTAHFETSSSIEVEITPICPNMIHDNIEISSNEKIIWGKLVPICMKLVKMGKPVKLASPEMRGGTTCSPPRTHPVRLGEDQQVSQTVLRRW